MAIRTGFPQVDRNPRTPNHVNGAALTVLLLALQMPALSSAWSIVQGNEFGNQGRHLSVSSTPQTSSLAVDLIPYNHFESPFPQQHLTSSQRLQIKVKSSRARLEFLSRKTSANPARFGTMKVSSLPISYVDGLYVIEISLGTPPRKQRVIVEFIYDLVWVQCVPCTNATCYSQPNPYFDPGSSSSYSNISCTDPICALPDDPTSCSATNTCLFGVENSYNSTDTGNLAKETITLNGSNGLPEAFTGFTFGCGNNRSGVADADPSDVGIADGYVGLGQGNLSLVYQLGSGIDNIFSYCMVDYLIATNANKTSPLLLGSVGNLSLTYTPFLKNPSPEGYNGYSSIYYLDIIGITVDGVPLNYPPGTFALDSAGQGGMAMDVRTSYSVLVAGAYDPLVARMRSIINYPFLDLIDTLGLDICFDITNVTNPVFPEVVMQFTDLNLTLPTNNLFYILQLGEVGVACLGIGNSSDPGATEGKISIFGYLQQQNFQIGYDLINKKIGFAPTTC